MVERSTHRGKTSDSLITSHPVHLGLGSDPGQRAAAYRQWLYAAIDDDDTTAIRRYMVQERALGDERFQCMVEKALNRPAVCRPRGRPAKHGPAVD